VKKSLDEHEGKITLEISGSSLKTLKEVDVLST
jgi:hypothetical protein